MVAELVVNPDVLIVSSPSPPVILRSVPASIDPSKFNVSVVPLAFISTVVERRIFDYLSYLCPTLCLLRLKTFHIESRFLKLWKQLQFRGFPNRFQRFL